MKTRPICRFGVAALVVGCSSGLFATTYLHDGGGKNELEDKSYTSGSSLAWTLGGKWILTGGGWGVNTAVYTASAAADLPYPEAVENAEQGVGLGFRLSNGTSMSDRTVRNSTPARVQSRDLACGFNALPVNTGTFYLSFLVRADATALGQLSYAAANGCPGYSYGMALGSSPQKDSSNNSLLTPSLARLQEDGLQVGIKCTAEGVYKFVVGNKDGDDFVLLDSVEAGVAYFCVVKVEVGAGADGKERISGYVVKSSDWSGMTTLKPLGEMEIYSSRDSFRWFRLQCAYATSGGAVDFDEIKIASTIQETAIALSKVSQSADSAVIRVNLGGKSAPEGLKLYVGTSAKTIAGATAVDVLETGNLTVALASGRMHYARLGIDRGAEGIELSDQVLPLLPDADLAQDSFSRALYEYNVSVYNKAPVGDGIVGFPQKNTWYANTGALKGYMLGLAAPDFSGIAGREGSVNFSMNNSESWRTQGRKFEAALPKTFYMSALIRADSGPLETMAKDGVYGIGIASSQIDPTGSAMDKDGNAIGFLVRKNQDGLIKLYLCAFGQFCKLLGGGSVEPRVTYACVAKIKSLGDGKYQVSASADPTYDCAAKAHWEIENQEVEKDNGAEFSSLFVTGRINDWRVFAFDEFRLASTYSLATGGEECSGLMIIVR